MSKSSCQAITTTIAIELTRRSTLGALLASAALVAPASAVTASVCRDDPIFAMIEAHRLASAAWLVALDNEPRRSDKAAHAKWDSRQSEAGDAEYAATSALLTTSPTTLAGTVALLRYIQETDTDGEAYHSTDCGEAGGAFIALVGSLLVALAPLVSK